ncbi:MAG TPA: hypothetical protein VM782_19890 [Stellaceae bacterium]|nr:hypothetical protein [Stellaceae bacterium]
MHRALRLAYLIAAVLLLMLTPWSEGGVALVLFVAADLGAAALMLRPELAEAAPVVVIAGDLDSLALLRRTVPELRMRRPAVAIDVQVRWRQAAEARRRSHESSFSLRH